MPEPEKSYSNSRVILFVVSISLVAASILAILSTALKNPQQKAIELYRSKQLLIAAHILNYKGEFILRESPEKTLLAKYDAEQKILVPTEEKVTAKEDEILKIYQTRVLPRLTDAQGNLLTFEKAGINYKDYLLKNAKLGYADLPYKLLYLIQPNLPPQQLTEKTPPYGYIIPINGYGLWDAIYGYLGLSSNADTVIGMAWYDQKETPGLGGNIALPSWQKQFYNKVIFQKNAQGETNYKQAPIGILVVKTTVEQSLGDSPKASSAVDGIPGASITVNGVSESYRKSLKPYRPFLIKAHERYTSQGGKNG